MRIVCISDTHSQTIRVPPCDLLIHAGDLTNRGTTQEVAAGLKWLRDSGARRIILVPGNHDWLFQRDAELAASMCDDNDVTLLVDKETVVEGVRIYGSPWQPWFMDWAFNAPRDPSEGADFLDEKWAAIPEDTDILVTHCPPTGGGRLDDGRDIGCPRLTSRIRYLNLDLHVFGHAHSGYGVYCSSNTKTTSINASICDEHYRAINAPILVRI